MNYAKVEEGVISQYPYTMDALKSENRNTSFPRNALERSDIRTNYSVVEVIPVSSPNSKTHNYSEVAPVLVNGAWTQTWEETPKSTEELNSIVTSNRMGEYGTPDKQIEFITENGLEAWQSKVAEIKARHPKA
tara:strand:+ start:1524 stop:1922 length:399 start_codon:yes stop_codon:yes gene_type:complete